LLLSTRGWVKASVPGLVGMLTPSAKSVTRRTTQSRLSAYQRSHCGSRDSAEPARTFRFLLEHRVAWRLLSVPPAGHRTVCVEV